MDIGKAEIATSYPGIRVLMMTTPKVTISPEEAQAETHCAFVTKCVKHIPRDNRRIQQWTVN